MRGESEGERGQNGVGGVCSQREHDGGGERSQPGTQLRRSWVAKQINATLTGMKALNAAHFAAPLWRESGHKRDANAATIRRSLVQKRSTRRDNGREGGRSRNGRNDLLP